MNPKYYLLVAAAALSLGGCSTDNTVTDTVPEKGGYKIAFTVAEDSETRTTLETLGETNVMRWVPTDNVGIYTVGPNSVNTNALTVADVNQSPVEFIGILDNLVSKGDMFYAYYPYDKAQSTDPAEVTLSIPAAQTQTLVGEYNGQSHPLVALPMEITWEKDSYAGRITSARFRLLGAIVELQIFSSDETLRSEKIQSVTFRSNNPLAGDFTFDLTGVTVDNEPQIAKDKLTETVVTTTLAEESTPIPATKEEAARVFLTIAPGTYTGAFVVETDFARYTFTLTEEMAMTFNRAVIKGLPADLAAAKCEVKDLDATIPFADEEVKRICVGNSDWNTDSNKAELSYREAAAVTSLGRNFYEKESITSFNELRYFTGLKSIGEYAFYSCENLTSVRIPDGMTTIGDYAFQNCSSLTSITIPQTVTTIGTDVFGGCTDLSAFYGEKASDDHRCLILDGTLLAFAKAGLTETEYTIPNGVTSIGESAFWDCSSLTSITIPAGVTSIGNYAFYGCSNLTSITIPEGVTSIGDFAFYNCEKLTSITIPQTVSSIGEDIFCECSSLAAFEGEADKRCLIRNNVLLAFVNAGLTETEYTIPDGVTSIGNGAFSGCSSLTSITIPNQVTSIGRSAFYGCKSLTSITIPAGVTLIENFAFHNCSGLTSVYCKPATPPTLGGSSVFYKTSESLKIYVPTGSGEAYKAATEKGWIDDYTSKIVEDNSSTVE